MYFIPSLRVTVGAIFQCGDGYSESVCSEQLRVSTAHGSGFSLGTFGDKPLPCSCAK